jgi:predicted lysophospholipase L1 biosynthesis ABC-type transport system permease subunit
MWSKFRFYTKHSLNDLQVNGQRTFFALLCIAAGVAAIVSLQTLGVIIKNTLTGSLQESNQGDIRISANLTDFGLSDVEQKQAGQDGLITLGNLGDDYFNENGLAKIQEWADENYPGQIEASTFQQSLGIAGVSATQNDTVSPFAFSFVVDTQAFPLYGAVKLEDGRELKDVIQEPTDIAINSTLADTLGVHLGDSVTIQGADATFTVQGIIEETSGGFGDNFGAALIGYYYIDTSALPFFSAVEPGATTIYWRLADPSRTIEINTALLQTYPYLSTRTTEDLRHDNEDISNAILQLVSAMGLLSMLIGGIGIVNTMQVIVRRRTVEVAVLKTIGLQAQQVTVLFLVEAFLMGIIGSIVGIIMGWLMTFIVKGVAEGFLGQSLPFQITAGPALTGLVVGILVTTVFGFLPTLTAGQVRPSLVLRPNDDIVPKAGRIRSFLALLLVIFVITLIAWTFIGRIAAAVVPGTFVVLGILYLILSLVIWLVGRFMPSFGFVDLKIAMRSMLASRSRGASTLLALVVGVFVLSVITLLTGTLLRQFQQLLIDQSGGNVLIYAPATSAQTMTQIEEVLENADGVNSFAIVNTYSVELLSVQDGATGDVRTADEIRDQVDAAGMPGVGPESEDAPDPSDIFDQSFGSLDAREIDSNLPDVKFYDGRQLESSDSDSNSIVISVTDITQNADIQVGDQLTFAFRNSRLSQFGIGVNDEVETRVFEVVGVIDRIAADLSFQSQMYAPINAFPDTVLPESVSAVVDMNDDQIGALRQELSSIPSAFLLETKLLNDLVNKLVNQFTSFPILVAALSLAVGGIVIANSVALTTLERKREIAVMKAVGLQRERVLGMLLLENGLMGFIGGLIGVGIGMVVLLAILATLFGGVITAPIPYSTALLLMALCIGISIIAAMLTAWGASGEKPLNVLRYE